MIFGMEPFVTGLAVLFCALSVPIKKISVPCNYYNEIIVNIQFIKKLKSTIPCFDISFNQ